MGPAALGANVEGYHLDFGVGLGPAHFDQGDPIFGQFRIALGEGYDF